MRPNQYQEEITTPIGGHKVIIKTMLTAAEREQVDSAQMEFMSTTDGVTYEVKDLRKVANAERHALLKTSVVSIDGDPANCFERLQKMYNPDYQFILKEIQDRQKKALEPTSETSS